MPSSVNDLLELHDRLLAERPDGAVHDEEACPLCALNDGGADDLEEGGSMSDPVTYSEAELQAAVDKAVAEATASAHNKLAELESSQAIEAAVAQAKADLETQVADLQAKLDAAVLEAAQAKEAKETLEKAWADEKAAEEAAKTLAARREERLAKVREVASFPKEYLEENGDRFAALSDEDFEARLEEWRVIAKKEEKPPARTAFKASREDTTDTDSALGALREMRAVGADPRSL